jgi:hypothetical protein
MMKTLKKIGLAAALAVGLSIGTAASAQTVGYNIRTGDVWVDTRLGEINDYGRRYRDPFVGEMTGYYGAPRSLIVELLDRRGWAPADVYYACALAHSLGIPCANVVREYDRNPGQGWGNVAKRYGIKPGSPAFHALKRGTVSTYGRWGYPVVIDRPVRVDWSKHGPGKSQGKGSSPRPAVGGGHGKSGHDSGDQGGKGKDKGQGGGKEKGSGKDKGNGKGK